MLRRRSAGFTLIEALVAVTLLALLFGALMPVFQQGLAVLRIGDRHSRAVLLAQSVLDHQLMLSSEKDDVSSSSEAPTAGEFDDYRWQVVRAPFVAQSTQEQANGAQQTTNEDDEDNAFALVQISVTVSWPDNDSGVQLHTLAVEPVQ